MFINHLRSRRMTVRLSDKGQIKGKKFRRFVKKLCKNYENPKYKKKLDELKIRIQRAKSSKKDQPDIRKIVSENSKHNRAAEVKDAFFLLLSEQAVTLLMSLGIKTVDEVYDVLERTSILLFSTECENSNDEILIDCTNKNVFGNGKDAYFSVPIKKEYLLKLMEATNQFLLKPKIDENLKAWGFALFDFRFEKDWMQEKCIPHLICDTIKRLYIDKAYDDKTGIAEINREYFFDMTAWCIGLH